MIVNFHNRSCKAKMNGSTWARFTIVFPSSHHESLDSKKRTCSGVCSMNIKKCFLPPPLPSLFSTPSLSSLGRGSIIFWHGSLGKQGKD